MKSVFAAVAALTLLAAPANAAIVLDQDNLMTVTPDFGQYSGALGLGTDLRQAQIVTAGVTGTLSRVDLQVRRGPQATGALILQIVSLPLPTATGPGVVVGGLTTAFDGQTVSVDVSSLNFAVTAGSSFALLLRSDTISNENRFGWLFGEQDIDGNNIYTRDYAGGVNSIFNLDLPPIYNVGAWGETSLDRGFATYVETGAVPEPASWALMIAGFGMTGAMLRRRRPVAA
ncbi:MAG TPA: PEPxxWA-CTERM sorting domain-containing protein [Polymorphobacter sp.]|nr:PEPxxWA-CTERM sorting domain-containing protein [Polymorphobacter sp.]